MLRVSEDGNRRRESYVESYRQLGRSLLDLEHAADRIFDAISQRTAQERDMLTDISRRIQLAKAKIDDISRSERAVTITSPSRYPSSCISDKDFQPLFQYKDEGTDPEFPTKLLVNGGLNREFGIDGTLELFQFFSEENTGYPSKETQSKAGVKLAHPKDDVFIENLFETSKLIDKSSLAVDASDSTLVPKKEELPPPPPSLLLNNFRSLEKSEDFRFISTIEPSHVVKLSSTKDAISDPAVVSDTTTSGG
ncbi:uncharacterized protein LOC103696043 [Phoenix dactylifera]|uniref:Uncharacterized protein LOC103696043 n=1 Tax=Phoenix dactylifera TaxID=42345 RepID=A0A8B8IZP9_PHODC|nr:uncharacterized protein LOC103696043 [Phoenix dactylifera]XP_008775783.2 uncharacterized protein LOC103696043 [Phoenix dactylifera]XP_008775791.2 uncharacterized protein LOC103696043 [Phoenix dactylifera]XP_008775800.2 uncharacterized protein LOC103696043 [Phoenix dactylifera]XP_026656736.2 uncharacterized protein LOC103696043 [Phoenix dactylifera]